MDTIWLIFVVAMAACVGSFLNVVIYRLPRGESIVFPGSHCPSCGWAIKWYDNIPLLSWFALRGRCRKCKCSISPRYVIVEAATALRVGGLFACYYVFQLREGAGTFPGSWPMFVAHASLLCGLLACAIVDAEHYQIPLEVMWVCTIVGFLAAAGKPHPFLASVTPTTAAVAAGAAVGLLLSLVLLRRGILPQSFLDARDIPAKGDAADEGEPAEPEATTEAGAAKSAVGAATDAKSAADRPAEAAESAQRKKGKARASPPARRPSGILTFLHILVGTVTAAAMTYVPGVRSDDEEAGNIAMTAEHGVNPRKEILWELLFLLPPLLLALAAWLLLRHVPAVHEAWFRLLDAKAHPQLAPRLAAVGAALFGYLIGGLWVWGTRILGTLAFNKEAMGMGDVHILAAVGAVTGWIVPSLTFFAAPFVGLVWALYTWIGKRRHVVPYGPHLATACLVVMVFYDPIVEWLRALFTGGA